MSGFLEAPAPRWFTIAAHRPFLTDLAAGVWAALGPQGPEALARAVVLLPNRRAARDLTTAFIGLAAGGAIMPPQMRALGDLDEGEPPFEPGDLALELPAAISPARRRFELAGLVAANHGLLGRDLDAGAALELADALAGFLDSLQIEEVGPDLDIDALAQGDLAQHWRRSADFLRLALQAWPARLAELGLMDVAARRVALLRRLAERWRERPPEEIVIAAGSTGSTPATAELLAAVGAAPRGCVVLPGLDQSLADKAWDEVGDEHPQGALRRLLAHAGLTRGEVRPWSAASEGSDAGRWRRRIINEALRPPERTADWLEVIAGLRAEDEDAVAAGLEGLTLVTARGEEEAATTAALLLREALETPGRTAALVTPDAGLARRVSARLTRWDIGADSSLGQALASEPAAVLAGVAAATLVDPLSPVALLAILKHPFTRLGMEADALAAACATLERYALRGPRPADWDQVEARLAGEDGPADPDRAVAAAALARRLRDTLAPLHEAFAEATASAAVAARALAHTLDALNAGHGGLWQGQAGVALSGVLSALMEESAALPPLTRAGFVELLEGLMAAEPIRPGGASHPRLRILGVLEARLISSDLLILAGLEEGVWPSPPPVDPFLSRPMRARLGMAAPERRIGLAAHDFAQAACAPRVVLLHSARRAGAPSVASRWLWRLRTLIAGAGERPPERPELIAWARALDAPLADPPPSLRMAARPAPAPPVALRPRRLSVTTVERWLRDPYAIYARYILRLGPLDPPDAPVEARLRGTAVHAALERFAREHPDELPLDASAHIEAMLLEALAAAGIGRAAMAREQPLASEAAAWLAAFEAARRPARLHLESQGRLEMERPGGTFVLTARADRIEVRNAVADILDFKTGSAPSPRMVRSGVSPQLTLTAAILAGGGFADIGPLAPGDLLYVRVNGARSGLQSRGDGDAAALAEAALDSLRRRIDHFDDPATAYESWALPQHMSDWGGDYDHLARVWEWRVLGEDEA